MINPTKLTFIAALALGALSARAESTVFIAPVAGHLAFGQSHYSGETSYGFAVGTLLGQNRAHELSVEWTTAKFNYSEPLPPELIGGSFTRASGHVRPLLFGYRYRFGSADSRFRFFAGPSIGFTRVTGNGYNSWAVSIGPYMGDFSRWAFSIGGTAGIDVELTSALSLQLGYRYLHVDSIVDFNGYRINTADYRRFDLGSVGTHLAFASLRFRF